MEDEQKEQLRRDLEFAILRAERLTVLDPSDAPSSPKHPMELRTLQDVFALFGYSPDDLIAPHEQCAIFTRVRAELEDVLGDVATNTKKFDRAILLRDRLQRMKREFVTMQQTYESRRQQQEREQFGRGMSLVSRRNDAQCTSLADKTEREIEAKRVDLNKTHVVERAQLEELLTRLSEPHVKFSSLLLQLKDTEKNLAKLKLFEDARTVFMRADALEKEERAKWSVKFERFKDTKRELLRVKQAEELAELDKKLTEKRYITMRRNDHHRSTETQRMTNLHQDLRHAHSMDMHAKKVFSTNPAPVVRKSHTATASTFRGQQLLSTVQGKRLEVASLCAIHDAEGGLAPDGSVNYR